MVAKIREYIYFNKRKIMVGLVVVVGGVGFFFFNFDKLDKRENDGGEVSLLAEKNQEVVKNDGQEEKEVKKEEKSNCYFDVKGEVNKPGVYFLDCDKRVIDALKSAGGVKKTADTSVINLSQKIRDGMVIVVYSKAEIKNYLKTKEELQLKIDYCQETMIDNDACLEGEGEKPNNNSNKLVNINTASMTELMSLSGIGETKAQNIILYRNKTPFKTIEDLLKVEGIGESIYVNIKENITV